MFTSIKHITVKTWQNCQRTVMRFERKQHDNMRITLSSGVVGV